MPATENGMVEDRLAHAEWVTLLDGTRVIRYAESGEWCISTKENFERRVAAFRIYDPRTHVCVEREDMETERESLRRAQEDQRLPGRAGRTLLALNQWLSTSESK